MDRTPRPLSLLLTFAIWLGILSALPLALSSEVWPFRLAWLLLLPLPWFSFLLFGSALSLLLSDLSLLQPQPEPPSSSGLSLLRLALRSLHLLLLAGCLSAAFLLPTLAPPFLPPSFLAFLTTFLLFQGSKRLWLLLALPFLGFLFLRLSFSTLAHPPGLPLGSSLLVLAFLFSLSLAYLGFFVRSERRQIAFRGSFQGASLLFFFLLLAGDLALALGVSPSAWIFASSRSLFFATTLGLAMIAVLSFRHLFLLLQIPPSFRPRHLAGYLLAASLPLALLLALWGWSFFGSGRFGFPFQDDPLPSLLWWASPIFAFGSLSILLAALHGETPTDNRLWLLFRPLLLFFFLLTAFGFLATIAFRQAWPPLSSPASRPVSRPVSPSASRPASLPAARLASPSLPRPTSFPLTPPALPPTSLRASSTSTPASSPARPSR